MLEAPSARPDGLRSEDIPMHTLSLGATRQLRSSRMGGEHREWGRPCLTRSTYNWLRMSVQFLYPVSRGPFNRPTGSFSGYRFEYEQNAPRSISEYRGNDGNAGSGQLQGMLTRNH